MVVVVAVLERDRGGNPRLVASHGYDAQTMETVPIQSGVHPKELGAVFSEALGEFVIE